MTLDEMLNQFRVASRELFNNHFRVLGANWEPTKTPDSAPEEDGDAWESERRFSRVEVVLFDEMVCRPARLTHIEYGDLQPGILVELRSDACPIMLNRETKSGYWDFPVREVTRDARLLFIRFFDFDVLGYRDNRYVLAHVDQWKSHPETAGKRALIESQYVQFVPAKPLKSA